VESLIKTKMEIYGNWPLKLNSKIKSRSMVTNVVLDMRMNGIKRLVYIMLDQAMRIGTVKF
jgi:antitoxin component HigA of HigAB toxin-antitoxin module